MNAKIAKDRRIWNVSPFSSNGFIASAMNVCLKARDSQANR
jgi:hypothetical protein